MKMSFVINALVNVLEDRDGTWVARCNRATSNGRIATFLAQLGASEFALVSWWSDTHDEFNHRNAPSAHEVVRMILATIKQSHAGYSWIASILKAGCQDTHTMAFIEALRDSRTDLEHWFLQVGEGFFA